MQPISYIFINIKEKHKLFIAITLPIKTTSYNLSFSGSQIFIATINFHWQEQEVKSLKPLEESRNIKIWKLLQGWSFFEKVLNSLNWVYVQCAWIKKYAHCKRSFNLGWSHLKLLICLYPFGAFQHATWTLQLLLH